MSEQLGLAGSDWEGRDVVQRSFQWKHRPSQVARLSGFGEKVQRNGRFERERPGPRASQGNDVADGAERLGDVAGKAADVGALGDSRQERRFVAARRDEPEFVDRDLARLERDIFAGAGAGIGRLPFDLQRGIGGRDLLDRTAELREDVGDLLRSRMDVARRDDLAFGVERVRLLAETDGECVLLGGLEHSACDFGGLADRDWKHARC